MQKDMGCDCCPKSNYGQEKCSADRAYRESFCGVLLDNEREKWEEMSSSKKAIAKRRKKNKNKKTHRITSNLNKK